MFVVNSFVRSSQVCAVSCRAQKPAEQVEEDTSKIQIESYASMASLVFNQSQLGFSKERGGVSF